MSKDGRGTRMLLASYRQQMRMVKAQQDLLEELRGMHPPAGAVVGGGGSTPGNPTERIVLRLAREESVLQQLQVILAWRRSVVQLYIDNVEDSQIRLFLVRRYLRGFSWKKIAVQQGAGASESTVRMAVVRYTNRHPITWIC